jgi:hypothetical protein
MYAKWATVANYLKGDETCLALFVLNSKKNAIFLERHLFEVLIPHFFSYFKEL